MKILRKGNTFYLGPSFEERIGEISFRYEGETIVVLQTFVNEKYRGQGLARKLVEAVVELARGENKRIIPLCPYVRNVLENEAYADILCKD